MASVVLILFSVYLLNIVSGEKDDYIHVEVPEECKDKDFCPIPPKNYKELAERIDQLLPKQLLTEIEDRNGAADFDDLLLSPKYDWQNCPYRATKLQQYFVRNLENKHEVIAQSETFRQIIPIVECANDVIQSSHASSEDVGECFQDLGLKPQSGFKTYCKAVTAFRPIYIYEKNNITIVNHEVPVYCACKITSLLS